MPNVIEPAPSGRSKCRGCAQTIPRDALRFGERLPNPFGDGEMTLWFHPECAAYKRPEPFLATLLETAGDIPARERLEATAQRSLAHRRLPRIDGAERASSGKAKCRHCHEPIERGNWRIRLVFYEEGLFTSGGFIHLNCSKAYFETDDVREQVLHFSSDLGSDEREALRRENESC
jgi:NAD-dependent dihydropyrimidine dehydrogenase PreA subunit